jgi:hypothetical protein
MYSQINNKTIEKISSSKKTQNAEDLFGRTSASTFELNPGGALSNGFLFY